MKVPVAFSVLLARALSQSTFEPADFNVTEALLDNGVDVSAIHELADFTKRSLYSGCSIAVGHFHYTACD
jgi:hypothetical protein